MLKDMGKREAGLFILAIMGFVTSIIFFALDNISLSFAAVSIGMIQCHLAMVVGAIEDNTKAVKESSIFSVMPSDLYKKEIINIIDQENNRRMKR